MLGVLGMLETVFIIMGFLACSFMIYKIDKKNKELYYYIINKELKEVKNGNLCSKI